MRLDAARLCLDCEEVHDDQICPHCSSEAFAFLTRWIEPSAEPRVGRPARPRTVELDGSTATAEQVEAYRQILSGEPAPRRTGLLAKSMLGLAAFGLAGWYVRAARQDTARTAPPAAPQAAARKEEGTRKKENEERPAEE